MLAARALSSLAEDSISHAPLAASALAPLIELVGKGGAAGKVAMVTLNRMAAGGKTEVLGANPNPNLNPHGPNPNPRCSALTLTLGARP